MNLASAMEGLMLATVEDVREMLYNTLQSLGPGWHDRAAIASAIGKNKLNPTHVAALDLLVSDGRVEKALQLVEGGRGNVVRTEYRLVGENVADNPTPTATQDEPFSLSAEQAGTLLRISPDKFKALAAQHSLPEGRARSGSRRWRRSDVLALKGKE